MENLLLLVCCLGLGIAFRQGKIFPEKAYLTLNTFVIYVALPALILQMIPQIPFHTAVLMPVLMPWLIFGIAVVFFSLLGRRLGWSHKTIGALTLSCGLGNTSFMGIPVMQMLWGEEGVQLAILADQPGSFAVLATAGIIVASYYAEGKSSPKEIALRVFRFPPFLFFLLALFLKFMKFQLPGIFDFTLDSLGSMVVPLALVSVGMQLNPSAPGKDLSEMGWGLGFKLILAPLVIYSLYVIVLDNHSLLSYGSVMEAAMAPMITAAIVATTFGFRPELIGRIVGFGTILSFLTLPLWYLLLQISG